MRRIFSVLFFGIFISLSFAISKYDNNELGIHFNIPDNWTVSERLHGKVIDLVHESRVATINITYYQFESPVTANGLQIVRSTGRYDGWMNLYERAGTQKENIRANADESYIAVYSKHGLSNDNTLTLEELISGEYYFVKGNVGVVIALSTQHSFWKVIQANLRVVIDSFWLGTEREEVVAVVPKKVEKECWSSYGKNYKNQYYFDDKIQWNPNLKNIFEVKLSENPSQNSVLNPLICENVAFIALEDRLYNVGLPSGNIGWSFKLDEGTIQSMTYGSDFLGVVVSSDRVELKSLIPETGQVLFQKEIDDLLAPPLVVSSNYVILRDYGVHVLSGDEGVDVWRAKGNFDRRYRPIFDKQKLILVEDSQQLESRDIETGKRRWKSDYLGRVVAQPLIASSNVVFGVEEDNGVEFVAIDIETGNLKWNYHIEDISSDVVMLSATDQGVACVSRVQGSEDDYMLYLLNAITGEEVWKTIFKSKDIRRPLITKAFILFYDEKKGFFGFDKLTGEKTTVFRNRFKDVHQFLMTKNGLLLIEGKETYTLSGYK